MPGCARCRRVLWCARKVKVEGRQSAERFHVLGMHGLVKPAEVRWREAQLADLPGSVFALALARGRGHRERPLVDTGNESGGACLPLSAPLGSSTSEPAHHVVPAACAACGRPVTEGEAA